MQPPRDRQYDGAIGRIYALPVTGCLRQGSTGHSVKTCAHPVDGKRQATEPNSTSTGVGVLTSVLNFNLPFEFWIRKTAMVSVFWFAA